MCIPFSPKLLSRPKNYSPGCTKSRVVLRYDGETIYMMSKLLSMNLRCHYVAKPNSVKFIIKNSTRSVWYLIQTAIRTCSLNLFLHSESVCNTPSKSTRTGFCLGYGKSRFIRLCTESSRLSFIGNLQRRLAPRRILCKTK